MLIDEFNELLKMNRCYDPGYEKAIKQLVGYITALSQHVEENVLCSETSLHVLLYGALAEMKCSCT